MSVRNGFTLVELVVVLVLLGVILSVVTPALVTSGAEDDAAAVVELLRSSRQTAIATARSINLTIDPAALRAWVVSDAGTSRLDTTFIIAVPPGTTLRAAGRRVRFHFSPDGSGWGDTLIVSTARSAARVYLAAPSGRLERESAPLVVTAP